MNVYTGEVRSWGSLTPEQQSSGEWIRLPTDAGLAQRDPARALSNTIPIDKDAELRRSERLVHALQRQESEFANRGRGRR